MIKAVLFDLDGTLLPMNEDEFTNGYFVFLCKKLAPFGYKQDELVKAIWAGTKAMIKNDGSKTNENAFWECFASIYGAEKIKDKAVFDEFYSNEFKQSKKFCGENSQAKEVVDFVKSKKLKVILASNPVFPLGGMLTRLSFIGLNKTDFNYITSYETSHYAKPNPKYFEEILKVNNLKPAEVLMFGNSEAEDYAPATAVGIKTYLVGEGENKIKFEQIKNIINKECTNMKDNKEYLGKMVKVKMDRPLGSKHPKHGFIYPVNYGYIPNTVSGDGEELDAYVLGEHKPLDAFEGKVVAIIHRTDDDDDKLVVMKDGRNYTDEQIRALTEFQEQYFKSIIIR